MIGRLISNPNTNYRYGTTNILLETNENPKLKELINLIISSYENFFLNLNSYNYSDYKKKADLMAMN